MNRDGANQPFAAIAGILRAHADGYRIAIDTDDHFQLDRPAADGGKPEFVASVKVGKRYVALHLMPLYCRQSLVDAMPDVLRPRMHGKSCLNFAPGKPVPESELRTLIAAALAG